MSCCVSPGTSPTLSGRSGLRGQELRHQERTDAYRVEAELREAESSPGTNLQHISDREAPEGKSRDTVRGGAGGGEGVWSRCARPENVMELAPNRHVAGRDAELCSPETWQSHTGVSLEDIWPVHFSSAGEHQLILRRPLPSPRYFPNFLLHLLPLPLALFCQTNVFSRANGSGNDSAV